MYIHSHSQIKQINIIVTHLFIMYAMHYYYDSKYLLPIIQYIHFIQSIRINYLVYFETAFYYFFQKITDVRINLK